MGYIIHGLNLAIMLILPVIIINKKYEFMGPIKGTLSIVFYSVTFLKLWSYIQVNYWCYSVLKSPPGRPIGVITHRTRNPSMADFSSKPKIKSSSNIFSVFCSRRHYSFKQSLETYY